MTETEAREKGLILAQGKTKLIARDPEKPHSAFIISKNDITAGDGAKHDVILGKAALATRTTCNVFRLLKACGIPVAFTEQIDETTFSAPLCKMLPYEVVVRREAHGSYLKRMPQLGKGFLFPKLLTEFFLKTSCKAWKHHSLVCDDPLMRYSEEDAKILLYDPSKPFNSREQFLTLNEPEVFSYAEEWKLFKRMRTIAARVFLILEKAWQMEGRKLVDFKVEFGIASDGTLLLADVIDNDSWRVMEDGAHIDKQLYRNGVDLNEVAEKYRRVAEITGHFRLPQQQVIVWCGSIKDDVGLVVRELDKLCGSYVAAASQCFTLTVNVCSIHKEPVRGLSDLHMFVQNVPDTVVIAFIGRSNGAGPTLSAVTTVPVITVPASFKEFPNDVWSSLRTPSNVPVMTVLEPSNAALAALEILALRNPHLYMFLREEVEGRLVNTIPL